jgi:peptide/nickel transport system substrate-binding protein
VCFTIILVILLLTVAAAGRVFAEKEPQEQVLVAAAQGEVGSIDPCIGGTPWTTQVVSALYEAPVGYRTQEMGGYTVQAVDDQEGWRPLLAERVEISEDGRVITFHLRKDVRFYPSGNTMTAEDWVWSWKRQLSKPPLGWCVFENKEAGITSPESVTALDDYTVRIELDHPNPRSLPFMRFQMFAILDSRELRKHTTEADPWAMEWLAANSAGTGPYYISSWDPGSRIELSANPYYWGAKPFYDRVVIQVVGEITTQLSLLRRGDVDVVSHVPPRFIERMRQVEGINVLSLPSGNRTYLGFNVTMAPFDRLDLRRAVANAVPYRQIVENVYFGHARPYDSFVLPQIPGYSGDGFDYELNLEQARRLLEQSGQDGARVTLKFDAAVDEHRQIGLLLQDYLGRAGLNVALEPLSSGDFTSRLFAKQLDFFIHAGVSWIDDPSTITGLWMEKGAPGNFTMFSNPEVERLQEKWQFEPYGPGRNSAYGKVQRVYNEQLNVVYLAVPDHIVLLREDIQGFVLYKDTGIRFHQLYEE